MWHTLIAWSPSPKSTVSCKTCEARVTRCHNLWVQGKHVYTEKMHNYIHVYPKILCGQNTFMTNRTLITGAADSDWYFCSTLQLRVAAQYYRRARLTRHRGHDASLWQLTQHRLSGGLIYSVWGHSACMPSAPQGWEGFALESPAAWRGCNRV